MYRILIADPISDSGLAVFKSQNGHFELDIRQKLAPEDLKKAAAQADAIIVRSETQITADVLSAASKVKIVGRAGVGVDNIDVQAASRKGVVVVNVPGGNTISAAEHTVALILALSRNIPQANASLKAGEWKRSQFTGTELQGKTLGLVGLGRIGREVARRCQSFDMQVIAYDPYASEDYAKNFNIRLVPLDEIYAQADFISVHVPLNDTTRAMFNATTLARLKPGVRLINCARGGIIDEKALSDALASGQVKGAALDVFEQEPPAKDHPLFGRPNVIVTPHLGASTEEAQVKVAQELAETLRDYFLKGSVRNAVNLPAMDAEAYRELEPYVLLCEKIGRFVTQMANGPVKELKMTYAGDVAGMNTTPLTLAMLQGFLAPILDIQVNLVNAPHLARERGLKWVETRTSDTQVYTSQVTLTAIASAGRLSVTGTLIGKSNPRIVAVDEMTVDVLPQGHLVIYANVDKPGVIGNVGSILGKNQINIAAMQVGRKSIGGEAITLVNIDSPVPDTVMQQLKAIPGLNWVKHVQL